MEKPFIGVKRIWYGDVFKEEPTTTTLQTWLGAAKEVKNSHEGTWSYTHDDADVTDYRNELSGKVYYRDPQSQGDKTIAFTIGAYDYETKAALQGGTVIKETDKAVGWKSSDEPVLIQKGIVALTKTGEYIVFTCADIIGKVDTQEKNLGLGISAKAMDNPNDGVADEYWFDEK